MLCTLRLRLRASSPQGAESLLWVYFKQATARTLPVWFSHRPGTHGRRDHLPIALAIDGGRLVIPS